MFRSIRVRIKAPSVKDVLDYDDPDVGSLVQPKNVESKVAEKERSVLIMHMTVSYFHVAINC